MSLTSQLRDRLSPVAYHVRFVGTLAAAGRGAPLSTESAGLLGLNVLQISTTIAPAEGASPQMVGTAFDYRLRFSFAACDIHDLAGWHGAQHLARQQPVTRPALDEFFDDLQVLIDDRSLNESGGGNEREQELCRACVVLAQFESIVRTGGQWLPELPVGQPVVSLAAAPAVADVARLNQSAQDVLSDLLDPVRRGAMPFVLNPQFDGSVGVGGADADLLIDDTLYELKTLKKVTAGTIRDALLQLVGYSLLDYSDTLLIRRVGIYFARQELCVSWPLWQLTFPPDEAIRHVASGSEPTEAEISARLEHMRSLMERAVAGEVIDHLRELSD